MYKYQLRFSFDYCGACLWGNDGAIEHRFLPVSPDLINELDDLCNEFDGHIDWNDGSRLWEREHYIEFFERADVVCEKLKKELGADYEVISNTDDDRRLYGKI